MYNMDIQKHFWSKVDKKEECWEWLGSTSPYGYGCFCILKKKFRAHRVSWMIHNGCIPEKMFVCHKCDNRKCVRPDHLFIGTPKDNMQDCLKKGRVSNQFKDTTHCEHGHKYTVENTRIDRRDGGLRRVCRQCAKINFKNWISSHPRRVKPTTEASASTKETK